MIRIKKHHNIKITQKAQSIIEYLLLLGVIVAITLIGFKKYFPRIQKAKNVYFNKIGHDLVGKEPPSEFND